MSAAKLLSFPSLVAIISSNPETALYYFAKSPCAFSRNRSNQWHLPTSIIRRIPTLYSRRKKNNAEFNGYVEPTGETVSETLETAARENAPYLTYLAPFSFQALRDGSLKEPPLNELPSYRKENRNVLVMVITNQENDQFSDELGQIILNNTSVQNKFLNNIVSTAKKYGFKDIHFDFEFLRPADREAYNQFLRKAKARFKKEGWFISTALPLKRVRNKKVVGMKLMTIKLMEKL